MEQKLIYQNIDLVDEETQKQINDLLDNPCLKDSNIAIMSDAHYLNGIVPVGFSATLENGIVDPNIVSADIACGITIMSLGSWKPYKQKNKWDKNDDFKTIDKIIRGLQIDVQERFSICSFDIDNYERFGDVKHGKYAAEHIKEAWKIVDWLEQKGVINDLDKKHVMNTFGTIGNGNHFIELLKDDNDKYYLAVHSGSRGLGTLVLKHFKEQWNKKIDKDIRVKITEQIKDLPNNEKQQKAIELKQKYNKDKKYCQVDIDEYYEVNMKVYEWAYLSRKTMLDIIIGELDLYRKLSIGDNGSLGRVNFDYRAYETEVDELLNISHNYLDKYKGHYIVRKGAVPNYEGKLVAVALTQCEGIVVGEGIDNEEMNYTIQHGQGRLFSRNKAKQTFTLEKHVKTMEKYGVYSSTVNERTLDEIMFAYKPFKKTKKMLFNSLKDPIVLKPVYNFKVDN